LITDLKKEVFQGSDVSRERWKPGVASPNGGRIVSPMGWQPPLGVRSVLLILVWSRILYHLGATLMTGRIFHNYQGRYREVAE